MGTGAVVSLVVLTVQCAGLQPNFLAVILSMGCTTSKLTTQLKLTTDELNALRQELRGSAELRQAIEGELVKVRNTVSVLDLDNKRLQQDLDIKVGEGTSASVSVFETAREEQERFREWIEYEIREGNTVLASLVKLHGADEGGNTVRELKRQVDGLEETDYNVDKLQEFSGWKYNRAKDEVQGLTEDRSAWVQFIQAIEEEIKEGIDQTDRDSEGKIRPQLADIRAKIAKLPAMSQPLIRFKALKELDKALLTLNVTGATETDGETKSILAKQAEEIKVLTQRLTAQRKLGEEQKSASEKELSLKEVHIKHLENKVKDLSRPSIANTEMKAKDREIERLRAELATAKAEQLAAEGELEAALRLTAELEEQAES